MRVKAAGYGRRVRNRGPLRHMLNKRCVLVMVWEMRRGIYTSEKRDYGPHQLVEWKGHVGLLIHAVIGKGPCLLLFWNNTYRLGPLYALKYVSNQTILFLFRFFIYE